MCVCVGVCVYVCVVTVRWATRIRDGGEQGWRSGESAHLSPMWLWRVRSRLASGFFFRLSGFPPSPKTNTPNSNSFRIEDSHEIQLRLV